MMIRYEDRVYIDQQLIFDVRQFGQTFWNYDKIPTHSNDYHVGVEYGYQLAIDKAYKWLENAMWYDDIYGLGTNGNENNVAELLIDFKKEMKNKMIENNKQILANSAKTCKDEQTKGGEQ